MANHATQQNSATFGAQLRKFDLFGAQLPHFNVQGSEVVKTNVGGLVSLFVSSLTFLFALLKLQHLLDYKNPMISTYDQEIEPSKENAFSLNHESFMLAFGIDRYQTTSNDFQNDERYVKWFARSMTQKEDGEYKVDYLPVRKCSAEDFDRFYEPSKSSAKRFQEAKESGGFYCIDSKSIDLDLYSSWLYEDSYAALEIFAAPCGFTFDQIKEPVREDCIWDRQATLNYLGTIIDLVVLYNQGIFK